MRRMPRAWTTRFALAWLGPWLLASLAVAPDAGRNTVPHALSRSLLGISSRHPFGCDAFGRDLLAAVLHGSATSLLFAGAATLLGGAIAVIFGTAVAVAPGAAGWLGQRALDAWLAFPSLLLALAWAAIRGPGWSTLVGSLLLGTVPGLARLVAVRSRELLSEDFVAAARSLGAGTFRVLRRHLLPGVLSLVVVKLPNLFAGALAAEATLSFMGVGAPVGRDTLGTLLAQGREYLFESPHIALGTGIPLVLTVLALQLLSEDPAFTLSNADRRG